MTPVCPGDKASWETHQLLEKVAHGDLAVPLLHLGAEVVVKLLVDLVNILDLVEDGLDLLDGEHGLGGGGCGLQGFHGLRRDKVQRWGMNEPERWQVPGRT